MRILAIAMVAAMASTSAMAETVTKTQAPAPTGLVMTGAVNLDFAETTAGKTAGTMGIELDVDAGSMATVDLDFKATDGSSLTLDTWAVGTSVAGVGLTFGDDNGLLPSTTANTAADGTLADPAMTESVVASVGALSVAVGLVDWTADITDVSNLQGAYTVDAGVANLTASLDYNRTTENTVFGGELDGLAVGDFALGGLATYDTNAEAVAYEGTIGFSGLTAYLNGSDTNKLQHIGGEYVLNVNGAELSAGVDYDTDGEDFTPQAGLSFSF